MTIVICLCLDSVNTTETNRKNRDRHLDSVQTLFSVLAVMISNQALCMDGDGKAGNIVAGCAVLNLISIC